MTEDLDRGGEAPCWAHFVEGHDRGVAPLRTVGTNTILYTDRWSETVDFYRVGLGLPTTMEREWFIEFELHPGAHVSVADARQASITSGDGSGLTLSWRVPDAGATREALAGNGIDASPVTARWGSPGFVVFDPAGNRIELWSAAT